MHDVGNPAAEPAVSVHAYSPPLTAMSYYADSGAGPERGCAAPAPCSSAGHHRKESDDHASTTCWPRPAPGWTGPTRTGPRRWSRAARSWSTPGRLAARRRRVSCPGPWSSSATTWSGGSTRRRTRASREAVDHDVTWIVVCSEGYSSSLAAASLQDLGLRNATDLAGGFQAWKAAGLPVH